MKIGGPGVIVEIDEAYFSKRMHYKGRVLDEHWILGGVERSNKTKSFFLPVPNRNRETLFEAISANVAPGSVINLNIQTSKASI